MLHVMIQLYDKGGGTICSKKISEKRVTRIRLLITAKYAIKGSGHKVKWDFRLIPLWSIFAFSKIILFNSY